MRGHHTEKEVPMPRITRSKRLVIPQGATVDVPATWSAADTPVDSSTRPPASSTESPPVFASSFDRLFSEPGALLYWLGTSISGLRVAATRRIMAMSPMDDYHGDYLPDFMRREWQALGSAGAERVRWLDQAMRVEDSLMAIELIAVALGVQGEDGLVSLLDLLGHHDFSIRHKAAIGLGAAGGAARWTVPAIARHLEREPVGMVTMSLLISLMAIGGPRAERIVEQRRFELNDIYRPFVEDAMDAAERHEPE